LPCDLILPLVLQAFDFMLYIAFECNFNCWFYANIVFCYWRNLQCLWRPFFARFGPMLHILCRNPTLAKCGGEAQHLEKLEVLESSRTPECSELNSKGQNTSHWDVLGVIGKVLKRRYRKCHRIGNSDICSPSYGQKKGRELNWQFDSRQLKVENRPLLDVRFECATWRWKDLDENYNFGLDLVAIQLCSRELWWFKVPGVPPGQFRDSISGVPGICAIRM